MITSVKKNKIPSRYGFVLKTRQLEDLILANDINIDIILNYWLPQIIGTIFEAHFWPPNYNFAYNRLYIRAGALLREDIYFARGKMASDALPEFAAWIKNILALPDNSPLLSKEQYFNAIIRNGELIIEQ